MIFYKRIYNLISIKFKSKLVLTKLNQLSKISSSYLNYTYSLLITTIKQYTSFNLF